MISTWEPLANIIVKLRHIVLPLIALPLELIIFPSFPAIPLNSTSFPSEKNLIGVLEN